MSLLIIHSYLVLNISTLKVEMENLYEDKCYTLDMI